MNEYSVSTVRTPIMVAGRSYDLEVDVYSPVSGIDNLAILAPSWFTVGERVAGWARRLAAETGTMSVLTHFPGHGRTPGRNGSGESIIDLEEQLASLTAAKVVGREECRIRGFDPHGVLYGGSSGGLTVVVMAAVSDPETQGIFGISPFCSLNAYRDQRSVDELSALGHSMSRGVIPLKDLDGRKELIYLNMRESLPSLGRINFPLVASEIKVPIWLSWGSKDAVSSVEHLRKFATDVATPVEDKVLWEIDAGHSLAGYETQIEEGITTFVKTKFPKRKADPQVSCFRK